MTDTYLFKLTWNLGQWDTQEYHYDELLALTGACWPDDHSMANSMLASILDGVPHHIPLNSLSESYWIVRI